MRHPRMGASPPGPMAMRLGRGLFRTEWRECCGSLNTPVAIGAQALDFGDRSRKCLAISAALEAPERSKRSLACASLAAAARRLFLDAGLSLIDTTFIRVSFSAAVLLPGIGGITFVAHSWTRFAVWVDGGSWAPFRFPKAGNGGRNSSISPTSISVGVYSPRSIALYLVIVIAVAVETSCCLSRHATRRSFQARERVVS